MSSWTAQAKKCVRAGNRGPQRATFWTIFSAGRHFHQAAAMARLCMRQTVVSSPRGRKKN